MYGHKKSKQWCSLRVGPSGPHPLPLPCGRGPFRLELLGGEKLRAHGAAGREVAEELEQERLRHVVEAGVEEHGLAADENALEAHLLERERAVQVRCHEERRDVERVVRRLCRGS